MWPHVFKVHYIYISAVIGNLIGQMLLNDFTTDFSDFFFFTGKKIHIKLKLLSCFAEYAQVTKMLGNGRLEAMCFDGAKRLCHIRGKLRKKVSQPEKPGQTSVICWVLEFCNDRLKLSSTKTYTGIYNESTCNIEYISCNL